MTTNTGNEKLLSIPSSPSSDETMSSKSVPSPSLLMVMISLFNSKTEMPVPSNVMRWGSFWDLNLKNTDEDMTEKYLDGS